MLRLALRRPGQPTRAAAPTTVKLMAVLVRQLPPPGGGGGMALATPTTVGVPGSAGPETTFSNTMIVAALVCQPILVTAMGVPLRTMLPSPFDPPDTPQ